MAATASRELETAWTEPPGGSEWVVLFDGQCRFCTTHARQLRRLVGAPRVRLVSFQAEGVLATFPGLRHEDCMKRIHVIRPDGRV